MPKKLQPEGYSANHKWIVKNYGSAKLYICSNCQRTHKRMEWANKSGKYIRERKDWEVLCNPCHQIKDNSGFYVLRKDKIDKMCKKCSKLFKVFPYRKDAQFCSISCSKRKC